MKKLNNSVIVLMVLVLAVAVVLSAVACAQPVTEETTFTVEVRKYNGTENYSAKLDGELLASKTITVKAGQVKVSEALAEAASLKDGVYTLSFSDGDYLTFSDKWWLTGGNLHKETGYAAEDYSYSYMAWSGEEGTVASSGITEDALSGLKVYVIVIDGWDGEIGTTKPYAG